MEKVCVTCAVIVKNGMVLAASRGESVGNAGRWEFPGGKPNAGESFDDCIVRRVKEELGLNIRICEAMPAYDVKADDNRIFEMHPYFVEVVDGIAVLVNHSRAEWFMPVQLMRLAWPQTDLKIIEEIFQRAMMNGKVI